MSTFDTIAPVNHFRDLMEISEDDVDAVMGELKGSAIYDYILIDLGYFYLSTFRWLLWCDITFLTGGKDKISIEKKKTLRHYMQMEGQEDLWKQFYDIQIPKVKNMVEEEILKYEQKDSIEQFAKEIQQQMTKE